MTIHQISAEIFLLFLFKKKEEDSLVLSLLEKTASADIWSLVIGF
jgi:hypothetical protein